jgi:amidase
VLLRVSAEQAFEQDADLGEVDVPRRLAALQWSMMALPLVGSPALAVPTGSATACPSACTPRSTPASSRRHERL